MNNLPLVSIIIASLNGRRYLKDCIDSINSVTYPRESLEIILVDDGSRDKTYEYIRENFSGIKIFRNFRNMGAAESRNVGIENAKGRFLAFLDNDVVVEKNWLPESVKVMEEDQTIGICASKIFFKDDPHILNSTGGVINLCAEAWDRGVFERDQGQYDDDKRVFFACSAAMLARKDVVEEVGGFDPMFRIYEDVDLAWRVNLFGYKVVYVPLSVAYHKRGGTIRRDGLKGKYTLEKSRIRIALKNYEGRTLFKNVKDLLRMKFYKLRKSAMPKPFKPVLFICACAAWGWNIVHIFGILNKRCEMRKKRIITDGQIFELMGRYKYESCSL